MCALLFKNKHPMHHLSQIVHPVVSLEVALGKNIMKITMTRSSEYIPLLMHMPPLFLVSQYLTSSSLVLGLGNLFPGLDNVQLLTSQ